MRNLIKRIAHPVLRIWYKKNNNKPRVYHKDNISITVFPGVFHPGYFLSTNIFIDFLKQQDLQNKKVLELGAGSGFISFYLAKHNGTIPTVTDINQNALKGLKLNSEILSIEMAVIESDLFDSVSPNDFDIIIINPPYYPQDAKTEAEQAFFCGSDFDYFKKLFDQLNTNWKKESTIYMILSEDCKIHTIKSTGKQRSIQLKQVHEERKLKEKNYIFELIKNE